MTEKALVVSESHDAIKRFRRVSKGSIATGASVSEIRMMFVIFDEIKGDAYLYACCRCLSDTRAS